MNPAKEVGGDFFDFFLTDEDHLCMIIADVSGKGVPAALFMMASKIFLYTDGVPEADNAEKEMFGTQRMLEELNRNAGETPAVILANTRAAIRAFAGKEEQFDDITMLCLEYKGRN